MFNTIKAKTTGLGTEGFGARYFSIPNEIRSELTRYWKLSTYFRLLGSKFLKSIMVCKIVFPKAHPFSSIVLITLCKLDKMSKMTKMLTIPL
jgi:hypothetical protein